MTKFNDISGGSTCPSQLLSWGSVWGVKFSPRQTGLSIEIGRSRTDLDIFVGTLCPWLSGVSMPRDGFFPAWCKAEAGWILWPGKKTTNIASRGSSRLPNTPFPNITYGANWLKVVNLGLALAVLFSPLLFPADLAGWQVPTFFNRLGRLAGDNLPAGRDLLWMRTCHQPPLHCSSYWTKMKKQVAANISKSHFFKQFSM